MTDELTAGRELDRRVAEALGYTVYHYDKGYKPYWILMDKDFNPAFFPDMRSGRLETGERDSEAEAWFDAPRFSEEEGDAVRALMTFDDWELWHEDGLYQCLLGCVWYRPACPDFCLAICGAILQAAGQTGEREI